MKDFEFNELDTLTRYHLRFYKKQRSEAAFFAEHLEVAEAHTSHPLEALYVFRIEQSLQELNEEERLILLKENIENAPKLWWMDYFSKSTYYRIKQSAMNRFIHCLHG